MRELERDFPATPTPQAPALAGGLTIVGLGRAGGAIARAAGVAGIDVSSVGRGRVVPPGSGVVLLCVPDATIVDVCEALVGGLMADTFVGHVSGASSLAALAPASRMGHRTFSLHPLQTIPAPDTDLEGAACAVAGSDRDALALARALAARLEMVPFDVPEDGRGAYHAAASIASNFLITLEESAASLMAAAGVSDPRAALAPLVVRTAENWAKAGAGALTGPIARGDEDTVARHRDALGERAPELRPLYDELTERTRALIQAT
ncbi:MAG: DUF2520 domain-containing protein [Actinomycetota bacterium]|nr:DUF2520 domain-containing protein [Actinomycetota bacterium]